MLVAVVAAITLAAKTGRSTPGLAMAIVTAELSSTHFKLKLPAPPIQRARQPVRSVLSDGVTAATRLAENNAEGLEGVKSGIY